MKRGFKMRRIMNCVCACVCPRAHNDSGDPHRVTAAQHTSAQRVERVLLRSGFGRRCERVLLQNRV